MPINEYLKQVKMRYSAGISTEHSYRGDLQVLINSLVDNITVTNEPKRQACGAPDYIIQKKDVPLGYIEAKDIGISLDKTEKTNQMKRYLGSLDNLILTDYLEFRFYKYGKKVSSVSIASIEDGKLTLHNDRFSIFETHMQDFCTFRGQTIKSAEKLAEMMAQKARMMEDVLFNVVSEEEQNSLKSQLKAFRRILIHDLDEKTFADIYAQTIAYGLFAARLHDESLDDFTRHEARDLIPRSNPFLRNLFDYISGAKLDDRVVWIVNDLCEIFRATDLKSILSDFGSSTGQNDPFIHFYETFLAEYDPKLRKSRGVYYTPEPVVNFMVRAVDDILQDEFELPKGLADTTTVSIKRKIVGSAKKGKDIYETKDVHRVQILDPATGTGTFLASAIKQIYSKNKGQEGLWSQYVDKELIPRINGFEILMASYTMCHLKIEMLLKGTGYKSANNNSTPRLNVFLTNTLEEANPETGELFADWLSNEAQEANLVKRDTPVMCIIGNPPYRGESSNKGKWIMDLMDTYKKEPGGHEKLKEKNSKWLNDDYVKFIRFAQYYIEKNKEGIIALITNNGFIENPTFRGMRWSLCDTFNQIYIINLHGDSDKKETCPDGAKDENIFDISKGVSINIFVKKRNKRKAKINYLDLYGKRDIKYDFLEINNLKSISWTNVVSKEPYYFFIPKDYKIEKLYNQGFSVKDLFPLNNTGIVTKRDGLSTDIDKERLWKRVTEFHEKSETDFKSVFPLPDDVRDWKYDWAKEDIDKSGPSMDNIIKIHYRPFEYRYMYYTGRSRGFVGWPVPRVTEQFLNIKNIGLITARSNKSQTCDHFFISNLMIETKCGERTTQSAIFPLLKYDEYNKIIPNFDDNIITEFSEKIGLYLSSTTDEKCYYSPYDLIDYIYSILYSRTYRERYKDFLKIDFPRIPFSTNASNFWDLVKLGGELRSIHLLENPVVDEYITTYPIDGSNTPEDVLFQENRVHINKNQYFDHVPEIAWNFYIGGYQPAQKWLKDRKGRELSVDEILHYQKIIVALVETDRIMKEIDKVIIL